MVIEMNVYMTMHYLIRLQISSELLNWFLGCYPNWFQIIKVSLISLHFTLRKSVKTTVTYILIILVNVK